MLIFWGTKPVTRTLEAGSFHCPQCGSKQSYTRKRVQKHGHLYFIPLFKMGEPAEYVECLGCRETFRPEVLEYAPEAIQDTVRSEFDKALRRLMVLTMMADGRIDEAEIETIQSVYRTVGGRDVGRAEVMAEVGAAQADGMRPVQFAAHVSPFLNDNGKELLMKAVILVATADGDFDKSELAVCWELAAALGMSAAHVKGILAEMAEPDQ